MNNFEFIYGYHAIKALLETAPEQVITLCLQAKRQDERLQNLINLAKDSNISIERISRQELDELLGRGIQHQGMVAKAKQFSGFNESALESLLTGLEQPKLILILDGLQDPHNLGACLRSANAFGVHAVIAPKDRAVGITPVVRKVASGAVSTTPFVQVTNLARTMRWLQEQGIWIIGTEAEGETILRDVDCSGDIAIVLGSEGEGMRRLTKKHCDYLARIPMRGTVDSLNVSVATAVSLYEIQRQRGFL